ncbi:MAG TPA: alpha/beta fold hydrolase [Candidatus Limnocylindrales bacterium]|nr:alpha/beta fold hydrolase [Candidatus Limnocylindrales bacterium]
MIRRVAALVGVVALPAVLSRLLAGRAAERLLDAPRTAPGEAELGPALDALGGEVVRLRSRDGLRLTGRWLPAEPGDAGWSSDPHEAILLLHGWSGSVAPDVVEYGPFLRRTAGVLGLDFRGHGGSDDAPTTFGMHEVEDVAGALTWLAERGIARVALIGTSMGGATALAAIVVLGDGSPTGADVDPTAPAHDIAPPRPRIIAAVADSVAPELTVAVANRLRTPGRRFVAARVFEAASRRVGGDIRAMEPIRIIGLVEGVPLLLIHGAADRTVPLRDGRRLVAAAGPNAEQWVVPNAEHSAGHATDPAGYEARVTAFLRRAFAEARTGQPIIPPPVPDDAPAGGGQEGD